MRTGQCCRPPSSATIALNTSLVSSRTARWAGPGLGQRAWNPGAGETTCGCQAATEQMWAVPVWGARLVGWPAVQWEDLGLRMALYPTRGGAEEGQELPWPVSPLPSPKSRSRRAAQLFGCGVYSCPLNHPRLCSSELIWSGSSPPTPSLGPGGAIIMGFGVHPSLRGRVLAAIPGPTLTPPFPHLPPSLSSASCAPPPPQLYLQARAPPEGDSDLATRLLTEPDVQKVPPWG